MYDSQKQIRVHRNSSDLPDAIIQEILSRLPPIDAAKSTIISNKWKEFYYAPQNLDFDLRCFKNKTPAAVSNKFEGNVREQCEAFWKTRFMNHVNDFITRRDRGRLNDLKKFRFSIDLKSEYYNNTYYDSSDDDNHLDDDDLDFFNFNDAYEHDDRSIAVCEFLDRVLTLVMGSKLEELHFNILDSTHPRYVLPEGFLSSVSPSLVKLFLRNCRLGNNYDTNSVNLNCLENLMLENVDFSNHNLSELLAGSSSLKSINIEGTCVGLESLKITHSCLRSITLCGSRRNPLEIDINVVCKFLTSLHLHQVKVTDEWVECKMPMLFPMLETLVLSSCRLLKRIKVLHNPKKLVTLKLLRCPLQEIEVHARSLTWFMYKGYELPLPLLINSSSFLQADLFIKAYHIHPEDDYFEKLREFLLCFGHCKVVKINCEPEVLLIPKELMRTLSPPLYDLKHIKIETSFWEIPLATLVENLLWLSPFVETISIYHPYKENVKTLTLTYDTRRIAAADEGEPCCCESHVIKGCWTHFLKEVRMNDFDVVEREQMSNYFYQRVKGLKTVKFD